MASAALDVLLADHAPAVVRASVERIAKDWNVPAHLVGFLVGSLPSFLRHVSEAVRARRSPGSDPTAWFSSTEPTKTRTRDELLGAVVALDHLVASMESVLDESGARVPFGDVRRALEVVDEMRAALRAASRS